MNVIRFAFGVALYLLINPVYSFHADSVDIIPSTVSTQQSIVQTISGNNSFDGPKIHPINGSVFEWWYFDAVSNDQKSYVSVVFYTTTGNGFPFIGNTTQVLSVEVTGNFPNGSTFEAILPAERAEVTTVGDDTSGCFDGPGLKWNWHSSSSMSTYLVEIDSQELGIQGSLSLKSTSPAHNPCGPIQAAQSLEIMPHVFWANAVPDADAHAAFTIGGSALDFDGVGYHDKNWGDQPFTASVGSWVWGHGRVGPFSIVWYDALTHSHTETVSGYLTRDGDVVADSCSGLTVRPIGMNSTYPPTSTSGIPEGFSIRWNLGDGGLWVVNTTNASVVVAEAGDFYTRWTGGLTAEVNGEIFEGVGLWEAFDLMP